MRVANPFHIIVIHTIWLTHPRTLTKPIWRCWLRAGDACFGIYVISSIKRLRAVHWTSPTRRILDEVKVIGATNDVTQHGEDVRYTSVIELIMISGSSWIRTLLFSISYAPRNSSHTFHPPRKHSHKHTLNARLDHRSRRRQFNSFA